MNFESFEDVIGYAIEREREAIAFYQDAAGQEIYSGGKRIFEEFAGEERKHEALLEGFLKGEKKLSEYQLKWVPDLKRSDYMVDLSYEKGMPYADVLRIAMKREEKSLALYNDLDRKTDKADLKKVFKILSQEEAKHKLALETLYDDYMAAQGD